MSWEEQEERYKPFNKDLLGKLYRFMWPYKVVFWSVVLMWVVWTVAMLAQPDLMRRGIDKFIEPAVRGELSREDAFRGLAWVAGIFMGLTILGTAIRVVRIRVGFRLGQKVINDLRMAIFEHIQRLSMSYFDRTKQGWVIARADSDLDTLEGIYTWAPVDLASSIVTLAGAITIMVYYNWRLALAVSTTLPPLFVITMLFRRKIQDAYREVRTSASRITANVAENISGIRVVQSFVREGRNLERFDELNRENVEANVRAARIWQSYWPGMIFISSVGATVIIWYGGSMIVDGTLTVGMLLAYLGYLAMFFGPIHQMGHLYNTLMASMAASERIFALLETEPEIKDCKGAVELPRIAGSVVFENVGFAYTKHDEGHGDELIWVLRDVSFEAKPGETIALVGPTGAGKSTIVSLIPRFYDVQEGRIQVDGHDVKKVTQESLHSQMGIVLQESFLFSGTVMENIKYGRPDATDDEVKEASKRLGSYEILSGLQEGFDTQVGERGESLSQGQRQLVSFTRAIVASPRILILDEATAAVDVQTEMALQYALERLIEKRTSFVVAHRLSTVRSADHVLVIQDGKITERGTHGELLAREGAYAEMYAEFIKA